MKNRLFRLFGKSALPTLLAGVFLAFSSPVAALAQGHGGGGHSGARSFSGGARGFSGGGYGCGGGYYRGGRAYYGGGLYLGLGGPYAYGSADSYAPAPGPCGFYDQAGYWHAGSGCYSVPAGY